MSTSVSSVSSTASAYSSSSTESSNELGRDAFLKLLLIQLQNQDPLSPTDDKEFIAQLAQFSSLEAMEKMSETMDDLMNRESLLGAAALIGKTVSGLDTDSGSIVSGVVESVSLIDGEPMLKVDGSYLSVDLLTNVS